MLHERILFSTHAARRMYERALYPDDVRHVLSAGEIIETYADDLPLPSYPALGWIEPEPGRREPVHVVAADDDEGIVTYLITVYRPDPERWEADYKTRRKQ